MAKGVLTLKDSNGVLRQIYSETSTDCLQYEPDGAKKIRKALGIYKNIIFDECENNWAILGTPKVENGELVLDGASYIQLGKNISLGNTPFTLECFAKVPAQADYNSVFYFFVSSNDRFRLCTLNDGTGKFRFLFASSSAGMSTTYADSPAFLNTKTHFAVSYDGSKIYFFADGSLVQSWTVTLSAVNYYLAVGADPNGIGGCLSANSTVDEFRISKICRYTENFTPATRFTNDADTLSLLHFD